MSSVYLASAIGFFGNMLFVALGILHQQDVTELLYPQPDFLDMTKRNSNSSFFKPTNLQTIKSGAQSEYKSWDPRESLCQRKEPSCLGCSALPIMT
ncbi:hypothetical protein E7T06_01355 [Deinococcus sp. Arct2-2]|uniref:hypothetical protein n=1 Tax=Deinococcus sp. Arct2-2 TaxID=2568653 RepID=UPI0010A53164|nr:hypothetical protein [Deinococcus sp. Arct2-2]THF71630.1 hypothetical protein E7T06_01355 [Deinococcus sp. Arct2-2]